MIVASIVSDSSQSACFLLTTSELLPEGQLCMLFDEDYKQEVRSWKDCPLLVPSAKYSWLVSSETHPCWPMQGDRCEFIRLLFI